MSVTPLLYLFVRTGSAGWADIWQILARPRTLELSVASLGLAAAVAAPASLVFRWRGCSPVRRYRVGGCG